MRTPLDRDGHDAIRHLHELDPGFEVPVGALDRAVWLDRLAWRFARAERTAQTTIAREPVGRCRMLTRTVREIERELATRTTAIAPGLRALPGCGPVTTAKLLGEIGPIDRFPSDAQLARHADVAPLEANSGKHQRHRARIHPPARAHLERKQSEGKSRREALRCLKRTSPAPSIRPSKTSGP